MTTGEKALTPNLPKKFSGQSKIIMNWKQKISIGHIMAKDEDTDESAAIIAKELADLFSKEHPSGDLASVIGKLKKADTQCKANKAISSLYDWADDNRIWLES